MASQTITGQDLQYTQDNQRCFAYSGLIEVDNTETTLLEFTTHSATLQVKIQFNINEPGAGEAYQHQIYFNDIVVQGYLSPGGSDTTGRPDIAIHLIIPPFTKVKTTSDNIQDSASRKCIVSVTGRVYNYLPVRN